MKHLILLLFFPLFYFYSFSAFSQVDPCVSTSEGKEFWVGFMDHDGTSGIDTKLYITSRFATTGTVTLNGTTVATINVAANGSQAIDLSPASNYLVNNAQTPQNKGVFVTTTETVSLYALNRKTNSADVALIFPLEALGKEYYTMSYTPDGWGTEFLIVATEDNTNAVVTPSRNTSTGSTANTPINVILQKGQTYLVRSPGNSGVNNDLTGSSITSDKPIAVFSGNIRVIINGNSSDHVYEQLPSVNTWGRNFVTIPSVRGAAAVLRPYDFFRIIAKSNNTVVTISGQPAPITLNAGQYHTFSTQGNNTPRVISSTEPVMVGQFTISQQSGEVADPYFIVLSPNQQTLKDINLEAIGTALITTYHVDVVTKTTNTANIKLDGTPMAFTAIAGSAMSYARRNVTPGTHNLNNTLATNDGFIAYVYGYGSAESYGYLAGSSLETVVDVADDITYCETTTTDRVLEGPDGFIRYEWRKLPSPAIISTLQDFTVTESGSYELTVENTAGCIKKDITEVIFSPPVLADITYNGVSRNEVRFCNGSGNQVVSALHPSHTAANIYTWRIQGNPTVIWTGSDLPVNEIPSSTTIYTVEITNSSAFCSNTNAGIATDEITVIYEPAFAVKITHPDRVGLSNLEFCNIDGSQVLTAELTPAVTGTSYEWFENGVAIVGATSSSLNVTNYSSSKTYKVIVSRPTLDIDCPQNAEIIVRFADDVVADIFHTDPLPVTDQLLTFCDSDGAKTLSAFIATNPAGVSYKWYERDNLTDPLPVTNIGTSATLVVNNFSSTKYYTVVITNISTPAACEEEASVRVKFVTQPDATIYNANAPALAPLIFCDSDGAQTLSINTAGNPTNPLPEIRWYNDDTNQLLASDVTTLLVNKFSSTVNYRLEVKIGDCIDIDRVKVIFYPTAVIQHNGVESGDNLYFCDAQGAQTISGGLPNTNPQLEYQWRDITDPLNPIVLPSGINLSVNNFSSVKVYKVTIVDLSGGGANSCILTDQVTVTFFGAQSVQIREVGQLAEPNEFTFCAENGARSLEVTLPVALLPISTIKWFEKNGTVLTELQTGQTLSIDAFQPNVVTTKKYLVRVTNNLANCISEDEVTVNFLPPLGAVLTGSTDICEGNKTPVTFRLSGSFPMTLKYRKTPAIGAAGAITIEEIVVGTNTTTSPFNYVVQSTGGKYEIIGLKNALCTLNPVPTTVVDVTVTPKPIVIISTADTSICINQTTKFIATGATSYVFYKNGLPMPAGAVANEYEPVAGTFQNGDKIWVIGQTNGCADTSSIRTMIIYPLPIVNLGVDRYKCKTDTARLVAPTNVDYIYDWKKIDATGTAVSVGNGNDTLFALDTGKYFVIITNMLTGCSNASNRVRVINFDDQVVVNLGADKKVCNPSDLPYRLVGSDLSHLAGTTYKWYVTGTNTVIGTDSVYNVIDENTYSVVVEDPRGCRIKDTIRIDFVPTPDFVIKGAENPNCSRFDTLQIERTNLRDMTIQWFGNGIVSTSVDKKTIIVNVSGVYTATITDNSTPAKCSYTQSVEVFVRPNIDLGLTSTMASDTVRLCEGDSLILDAFRPEHNVNFNYQWRLIEGNRIVSTNSKVTINYGLVNNYISNRFEVKVTDPNLAGGGNCSVLDTINVRFDRKSGVQIEDTFVKTLCLGQKQTLKAIGADAYVWSSGQTTSTIEITPTEAGFYTYIVKGTFRTPNLCGASADTIKFRVVNVPELEIPETLVICENDSVEIDAFLPSHEPRYVYEWKNENTGQLVDTLATHVFKQDSTNITYEPQTYRVGVYDTLGGGRCGIESLITVTFSRTSKTEIIASDTLVCVGEPITLKATGATNFRWNTGETTAEITFSSDSAGIFRYTVYGNYGTGENVCDSTGTSILIQFKAVPKITLNKPDTISICTGDSVQFIAKGGVTYMWSHSPAVSGDTVVVFPTDTMAYIVTGFDTLGCSSTDTTIVLVQPQIDLGQDQQLCEGDTAIIGAARPYGATYLWNTGQTSDTISVRKSGLYYVEVSINECSYTDSVRINFIEAPILFAKDTILCFEDANSNAVLHQIGVTIENYDSTARYRYQWFDKDENLVGQDSLLNVEFGGVYLARVTVEYANACTSITSLAVEANCDPQVFIPSAFTPNEDNLNEEWEIFGRFYSFLRIKVLDRWGMEVYSAFQKRSDEEIKFWDGTYKGKKVPSGVYYYEVTYTSPTDKSKTIKQTGTVTVIY